MSWNPEESYKSVEILQNGGILLFPTENGWVAGCISNNRAAFNRLKNIDSESKIVTFLFDTEVRVQSFFREFPEMGWSLLEVSEYNLTLNVNGGTKIHNNVLDLETVNIKICSDRFTKNLISRLKLPIAVRFLHDKFSYNDIVRIDSLVADYIINYKKNDEVFIEGGGIIQIGNDGLIKIIRK